MIIMVIMTMMMMMILMMIIFKTVVVASNSQTSSFPPLPLKDNTVQQEVLSWEDCIFHNSTID